MGGLTVRIEADCPRIGMGRSVEIHVAATWADGRPAAGRLLLPYVNGKRWGGHEYADAQGRATMILPLPNPGLSEIQVEAADALGMVPSSRQCPEWHRSTAGPVVSVLPPTEGWPSAVLARLLTGSRPARGQTLELRDSASGLPQARVSAVRSRTPRWYAILRTVQPAVVYLEHCPSRALGRLLSLVGSGCLAAAPDLAGRIRADFLVVDWSNQMVDRRHWDERADNDNEVVHSTTMLLEAMAALRDEGLTVPRMAIFLGLDNAPPTNRGCRQRGEPVDLPQLRA